MDILDFKVGQRVIKVSGDLKGFTGKVTRASSYCAVILLDNGQGEFIVNYNPEQWQLEQQVGSAVQPEPAQVTGWSYAEAQRLADAADAAIEAYNEYIKKQPTTVFIPKIK